jgi:peptidoglycan hydrolase-like protein with peptidoglycan-binding domain
MKKINVSRIGFLSVGSLVVVLLLSLLTTQKANAAITTQLDLGSRGSNVTELQQFLATNNAIYPQGLVTGYYGSLTRDAVTQFQVNYGLPQVGRVGPMTSAKINNIMASGYGLDIDAPTVYNVSAQTGRNSANINWTTNELTTGQVYYDVTMIQSDEATAHGQSPYISGNLAPNNSGVAFSQSVTIQGLQPNTLYYYLIRAVDKSGNVSLVLPSVFRTLQ